MRAPTVISSRVRRLAAALLVTGLALGVLWTVPR